MISHAINGNEVEPVNTDKLSVTIKPENYKLRYKLGITVDLIGSDYSYIKSLERDNFTDKHTYQIKNGSIIEYSGVFLINDISFDDDNEFCSITMTPENEDTYISENEDIEIDVLTTENKSVVSMERKTYWYFELGFYRLNRSDIPDNYSVIWQALEDLFYPYTYYYTLLCQERIKSDSQPQGFVEVDDLGGGLYVYGRSPVGFSELLFNDVTTIGLNDQSWNYVWTSNGYPGASDDYDDSILILRDKPASSHETRYATEVAARIDNPDWVVVYRSFSPVQHTDAPGEIYDIEEYVFIKTDVLPDNNILDQNQSYSAVLLKDVLSTIIKGAMPEFEGLVVSNTLFDDPLCPGEIDGNANEFPVIEHAPYYLIDMSDFKLPNASNPATIAKTTWNKIITQLKERMNLDWHIDLQDNLRIEHISYYDNRTIGLNLSGNDDITRKYDYEKGAIPNRMLWEESFSGNDDFYKQQIVYGNIPAIEGVKENKIERTLDYLYTDIDYMNLYLDSSPSDGFMFVEADDGVVRKSSGRYSGENIQNASLSIANCIYYLWKYRMYRMEATFNDQVFEAKSLMKLKKQNIECSTKSIINPKMLITTPIGIGEIVSIKKELRDGGKIFHEIELKYE